VQLHGMRPRVFAEQGNLSEVGAGCRANRDGVVFPARWGQVRRAPRGLYRKVDTVQRGYAAKRLTRFVVAIACIMAPPMK
jgi:hypothetical protein